MQIKILSNFLETLKTMRNEIFTLCCILLAVSSAQTDWEGVSRNVAISSVEKQPHDSENISFLLRQPEKDVAHNPSSTAGAFNATTERTKPANTSIANTKTANNNDSSMLPKRRISRFVDLRIPYSLKSMIDYSSERNTIIVTKPEEIITTEKTVTKPEENIRTEKIVTKSKGNITTEKTTIANDDDGLLFSLMKLGVEGIGNATADIVIIIDSALLSKNSKVSSETNTSIGNFIDYLFPSANETSKSTFGDSITKFLSEIDSRNFTALTETSTTIGNLTVSLISVGNETLGIFVNAGKDFIKDANTTTEKTTTTNDDDDSSILSKISTPIGKEAFKKLENAVGDFIKGVVSALRSENSTVLSETNTTIGSHTVSFLLLGNKTFGIPNEFGDQILRIVSELSNHILTLRAKHILLLLSGKKTLERFANAGEDFIEGVISELRSKKFKVLPAGNKEESSTSSTTIKPSSIATGCANDSCETKILLYVISKLAKRFHQYLIGPPIEN